MSACRIPICWSKYSGKGCRGTVSDRGCGLKGSAAKAMKFNGDLDVRLPNQRVLLTPARGTYRPNTAYCYEGLPLDLGNPYRIFLRAEDLNAAWNSD